MWALGKRTSRLLRDWYLGPDFPAKLRLWGWVRRLLAYPRFTISYAENGWITVDERDLLQRQIFVTGFYEPEVWESLSRYCVGDEIVWDVGAHIGSFAIRALLDPQVREVDAFEPDPVSAEILALNLALNRKRYTVHRFALSSRREEARLFRGPLANTGLSSLVPGPDVGRQVFEVDCRTADELVFREGVPPATLIKIDVEGWEFRVLLGARRLLTELPPKAIGVECECDEAGEILDRSLLCYLEGLGYGVRRIKRPSGIVDRRENFLAVHKRLGSQRARNWGEK